jgi:DNA-binding CsgD family transcriptional regulator
MEHWNNLSSDTGIAIDSAAVYRLLSAIGSADHSAFALAVLELVNAHVAMADCSMMAFVAERNPRLVSVCSQTDEHQTFHCANNYVRHLHQHDRIQLHLQSILPQQEIGHITVHRQTLTQIIDAELRRLYNDTLGIVDSMAITIKTGHQEWVTTSLCRYRDQGPLDANEIETILRLATIIATSASRHCRIEADGKTGNQTSVRDGIDQLCPLLTKRERQVILRILDGVTIENIASELGLKPTTVITYRSRAYEKLGISSRYELFSAVLHNRKGSSPWQPATIPDTPSAFNGPSYAASTGTDRPYQ